MSRDLRCLPESIRHVFAWGADDEASLVDWLDADSRFEHFAKLGRVLLFPDGTPAGLPSRNASHVLFDGAGWPRTGARPDTSLTTASSVEVNGRGTKPMFPIPGGGSTRPASIALMGAAMNNPYLDEDGRLELIARLKSECDWDLEDPARFYKSPAA